MSTPLALLLLLLLQDPGPQQHLEQGRERLAKGETAAALEHFTAAAQSPRHLVPAAVDAARACARLERADEAFGWLARAVGAGWGDRAVLAGDVDLQRLAEDERYASVLPALRRGAEAFAQPVRVLHEWVGEGPGDQFGWVGRPVGDLDGDGAIDFATTAPSHGGWRGKAYVYSSRSGELLFSSTGASPGEQHGNSVAGQVDVDGDGTHDVIVGGPGFGQQAGRVLVLSGTGGQLLHTLTRDVAGDQFGMKVTGLEDLNGDGCAEVAVGASGDGAGLVAVYSGKDGALLWELRGERAGDLFGTSLDGTVAGGHRLLVVGAPKAGEARVGRAYVYACTRTGAQQRFVIDTDEHGANLGQYFVTWLGDVDGDGVPDAYASDWNNGNQAPRTGRVFVHSGKTGKRLLTLSGHAPGEGFGTTAAVCGDVDGDGAADLVVGAWQHSGQAKSAGACYLHSGRTGAHLFTWSATQAGDTLGFDAVGLGDVDGDGVHDFLLTSAWSTVDYGRQGRVFLVSGPPEPPGEDEAR